MRLVCAALSSRPLRCSSTTRSRTSYSGRSSERLVPAPRFPHGGRTLLPLSVFPPAGTPPPAPIRRRLVDAAGSPPAIDGRSKAFAHDYYSWTTAYRGLG